MTPLWHVARWTALLFVLILVLFPLYWMVNTSIKPTTEVFQSPPTFFTFLLAWNAYVFALVLTTDPKMFPLAVGVPNMLGEYQVLWNELMAAAILASLPVVVLYGVLERYLVEGITAGALKA